MPNFARGTLRDEQRIRQMIEVMLACHGAAAAAKARKRAIRCRHRQEPEWAALWREVADRIARQSEARKVAAD